MNKVERHSYLYAPNIKAYLAYFQSHQRHFEKACVALGKPCDPLQNCYNGIVESLTGKSLVSLANRAYLAKLKIAVIITVWKLSIFQTFPCQNFIRVNSPSFIPSNFPAI